jgi:prepilin-type N-terminal cleavage/methylation domain-containing protein
MRHISREKGATLVELMVAVTIFLILLSLLYPAFSFLQARIVSLNDSEALSERGNRLLDYMAERIRSSGLIIGSNPYISFCGKPAVNTMSHTEGDPFDTITFLAAVPIETNTANMPYLRVIAPAGINDTSVRINTTNVSPSFIDPNGASNAKALVTFDVLKPSYPYGLNQWSGTIYTVASMGGGRLVFADDPATPDISENQLAQDINARSYVFAVRMIRFEVNEQRELKEVGWNRSCTNSGESLDLDGSSGAGNAWGGVDSLQFQYFLSSDPGNPRSGITADDLPALRSVRISLLLRAGFPTRYFINRELYSVGNLPARTYNDPYKRMLLTRSVDVRNMGLWRP